MEAGIILPSNTLKSKAMMSISPEIEPGDGIDKRKLSMHSENTSAQVGNYRPARFLSIDLFQLWYP